MAFCSSGAIIAFLLLLFPTISYIQAQEDKQDKPNIVIIFADDVGQGDVPGYWNTNRVDMPNLQDLIDHGVVYTDVHSMPNCSPSRYVLLSGRYSHRGRNPAGTWSLGANHGAFCAGQKSIAQVLRKEGNYHTAVFGKWHLGGRIQPDGEKMDPSEVGYLTSNKHNWAIPFDGGPSDLGFDHSYITLGGIQGQPYSFFRDGVLEAKKSDIKYWKTGEYEIKSTGDISIIPGKSGRKEKSGEGDKTWNSAAYNGILVHEMQDFLNQHLESDTKDPFFVYLALGAVHFPHSPPNFYNGTKVKGKYSTAHKDMLYEMDLTVGSVMAALEERNLLKNTIIIFASDNGGLSNTFSSGGLKGKKKTIWEGGHRVPFFVRYDGVFPTGERRHQLIGLNDVYATLLDLVNIDIPSSQQDSLDSVSFRNSIFFEKANGRASLGVWFYNGKYILSDAMVRQGSLKLIMQTDPMKFMLYDLEQDLSEKRDLSSQPKYTETMMKMMTRLTAIGPCRHDKRGTFHFQNSNDRKASCSFFKEDPEKRCNLYQKTAQINCAYTCAQYILDKDQHEVCIRTNDQYPPRRRCENYKKWFYMNGRLRNCGFLEKKNNKKWGCKTFVAQHLCPGICNKEC